MKPDAVVVKFLTSIARPAEARLYLDLFRSTHPESFAIICVSETVMAQSPGALATDLRFLSRLGLTPVVVFGIFAPDAAGDHARTVRDALAPDVACEAVSSADARQACLAGSIPLVRIVDFAELIGLAAALAPRKTVFLGRRSGLQPRDRRPPSLVDITTEYDDLAAGGVLPAKQAALLARIRDLLAGVSHRMTVSVTSPLDLLRELFTERGAGTLVRVGSRVVRRDPADVDRARLMALVNSAFDRALLPEFFDRDLAAVYIADDYRGAAVIEATDLGTYLSKFAVGIAARGEGIAGDLFRAVCCDNPRLFWRARAGNPIGDWYARRADGLHRAGDWTVYWRGMAAEEIPAAIDLARRAPIDFVDELRP